jgi:hypothetical protein
MCIKEEAFFSRKKLEIPMKNKFPLHVKITVVIVDTNIYMEKD